MSWHLQSAHLQSKDGLIPKDLHQIIHATLILCIWCAMIEFTRTVFVFHFNKRVQKRRRRTNRRRQEKPVSFTGVLIFFLLTIWNNAKKVLPLNQMRLTFSLIYFSRCDAIYGIMYHNTPKPFAFTWFFFSLCVVYLVSFTFETRTIQVSVRKYFDFKNSHILHLI